MTIEEFLQLSAGKWFSHRTSHDLVFKQSKNGKSDLIIEMLASDHPDVVKLCQQYEIDPSRANCGARVNWNGTMDSDQEKQSGSTVLVIVPDEGNPNEGKLLQEIVYDDRTPVVGRYNMGSDDALTLTIESETMSSEERLWFASPNLRMRTSMVKRFGGFTQASFTSEIRMGGGQPAAKVDAAAKSVSS
ncbi:MAG: phycobiliprotein lyase [Stigonema ocellatum SAG 48.90 = DSM 106950]|nr:phycobiliprotein lyase [Stigonema ocellatum SAG 48.90 = DSM 106950]